MDEVRKFISHCVVDSSFCAKAGSDLDSAIAEYCEMPGCTLSEDSKGHLRTVFASVSPDVSALSNKLDGMLSPDLEPQQVSADERETPGYVGVGR